MGWKRSGAGAWGAGAGLALLLWVGCGPGEPKEPPPPPWPSVAVDEPLHDFGEVVQGTRVEHVFEVRNRGLEELVIEGIEAESRLELGEYETVVPPQGAIGIPVFVETLELSGSGTLRLTLETNDPEVPETELGLTGRIVGLVEVRPQNRVYFLNHQRGQPAEKELLVVNHQERPLAILEVAAGEPRYFETALETVEPGQQYRLVVRLDRDDVVGKVEETVTIETDSEQVPTLEVLAVATVREKVFAEPASLIFSRFDYEELKHPVINTKRLRIRRFGGGDFQVLEVTADVPFLEFEIEPETPGESYIIVARIDIDRASRGPIEGTLRVRTNDPDFPELLLPISGEIL